MRTLRCLLMIAVLGMPSVATALDLSYTVSGFGGFSQPQAPFGQSPFPWIDWTGEVSGEAVSATGFVPVPVPLEASPFTSPEAHGSLLLSSAFTLTDQSTLQVTTNVFTASAPSYVNIGFTLLLHDGTTQAILANVRPDNFNHFTDFGGIVPNFVPPSPGVETVVSVRDPSALAGLSLGGASYGIGGNPSVCSSRCLTEVTSTLTPGPGTYQLLFGVFSLTGIQSQSYQAFDAETGLRIDKPTALAVTAVNVPEPSSWVFLALSLSLLGAWGACRWKR